MFKKLKRKVLFSLLFVMANSFIIVSVICYFGAKNIVLNFYTDLLVERMEQQVVNLGLFCQLIENVALAVSTSSETIGCIEQQKTNPDVIAKLDSLEAVNFNIQGVAVYAFNGGALFSSSITDVPKNEDIFANDEIADCIASDEKVMWVYRTNAMHIYKNNVFSEQIKPLSCIVKIFNAANEPIAILMVDIKASHILQYFHAAPDLLDNIYLYKSDTLISSQNAVVNLPQISSEQHYIHDGLLYIRKSLPEVELHIVVAMRIHDIYSGLKLFSATLAFVTVFLICLTIIIYKKLSDSIFSRLSQLYVSIKNR